MFEFKLYIIQKIYMLERAYSRPILQATTENKNYSKTFIFVFDENLPFFHFFPPFLLNIASMPLCLEYGLLE